MNDICRFFFHWGVVEKIGWRNRSIHRWKEGGGGESASGL